MSSEQWIRPDSPPTEFFFDSIEGQGWLNRVFQERLDGLEVELFDEGVLNKEETTNEQPLSNFVLLACKHVCDQFQP